MKFKLLLLFILVATTCQSGTVVIPTITVVAASSTGTISAGYTMVSIATSSTFTGTILGATVTAGRFYTFPAPIGASLPSIAYTVTAGSIEILTLK